MSEKKLFDFETTFPPLGHSEHHFNKYPNHPWLTTKEEIFDWVTKSFSITKLYDTATTPISFIQIAKDLTVIIDENFKLNILDKTADFFPVQFRSCSSFSFEDSDIQSLIGTPYVSDFLIGYSCKIKSLIGLSGNIKKDIALSYNLINNFSSMPYFKYQPELDLYDNNIESWDHYQFRVYIFLAA